MEKLAAAQELRQKIDVRGILEGADELDEARVVAVGIDFSLHADALLQPLLDHHLLVHALQRVASTVIVTMVNELDDAEVAPADDGFHSEILHGDVQVLQLHALLQLVAKHAHDGVEGRIPKNEADTRLLGRDGGRTALLEQQPALPEGVPAAQRPHLMAIRGDFHAPALDQVKLGSILPLPHNDVALLVPLPFQTSDNSVHLLIVQVLE
mmetsp:Transcript_91876/g.239656  ORF Transcript_91876/g.239656 Transcript_91876/m.239656 type:complete len:210 (+) Transcript_91876:890-1519(+)